MYPEYLLISEFYGNRTARRSGVRLMDHIDQGIQILQARHAGIWAERAFCLHPLLQADQDLAEQFEQVLVRADSRAVALALEYRNVANRWLSDRVRTVGDERGHFGPVVVKDGGPQLSPLPEVNAMLVADKVQNQKDFLQDHRDHPRFSELSAYFQEWLRVLGIDDSEYQRLCKIIDDTK